MQKYIPARYKQRDDSVSFVSIEAGVKEYVDTLNSAPNAWGAHMTRFGQSHEFLRLLNYHFGEDAVTEALNREFLSRKQQERRP